jgi:hypothetical protein
MRRPVFSTNLTVSSRSSPVQTSVRRAKTASRNGALTLLPSLAPPQTRTHRPERRRRVGRQPWDGLATHPARRELIMSQRRRSPGAAQPRHRPVPASLAARGCWRLIVARTGRPKIWTRGPRWECRAPPRPRRRSAHRSRNRSSTVPHGRSRGCRRPTAAPPAAAVRESCRKALGPW